LKSWDIVDELSDQFPQLLDRMAAYVPHITKPDGRIVPIGDTPTDLELTYYKDLLAPYFARIPGLKALVTDSASARMREGATVFKDEGYVVIRDNDSGRLAPAESGYLFFTAGAHAGRGHRQADDLSFTLSIMGRDLFVDSGVYSYKIDAARAFVLSPAAHNTVEVDGQSYGGWDTVLESVETNPGIILIRASHRNYPGFEHRRSLVYARPFLLFVIDTVNRYGASLAASDSGNGYSFKQFFQLAPDTSPAIDGVGVNIWAPVDRTDRKQVIARLIPLTKLNRAPRIARGDRDPMAGWYSARHGQLTAAPALIFEQMGQEALFVTAVEIASNRSVGESTKVAQGQYQARRSGNALALEWVTEGKIQSLRIDTATHARIRD
ncbi:MAG: heparinase II/III family protein, partial [bacterium]